jgi:hypothetical protein
MTSMSLFVDLTDTAKTAESCAYVRDFCERFKNAPSDRAAPGRYGELAAFRYAGLLGGVLLFSLSLSPFQ